MPCGLFNAGLVGSSAWNGFEIVSGSCSSLLHWFSSVKQKESITVYNNVLKFHNWETTRPRNCWRTLTLGYGTSSDVPHGFVSAGSSSFSSASARFRRRKQNRTNRVKTPSRMPAESDTRSVRKSCCTYRVAISYVGYVGAYIKIAKKNVMNLKKEL